MIQEDKQLLLIDLCTRLPYNVWISYKTKYDDIERATILNGNYVRDIMEGTSSWIDFKPYLRPMSSMTEEESAELSNIINEWFDKELFYLTEEPFMEYALYKVNYSINPRLFDWLNKKMFDYRGLIPKSLAIEVTKINNPYN